MAERMSVNQQIQLGVESVHGTSVPANRRLALLMLTLDAAEQDTKVYRPVGRKHSSLVVPNRDWVSGKYSGVASFTEAIYPLSGVLGSAVITTPAGAVTARQWQWDLLLSGAASPTTYTVENGSSVRAHKASYVLPTGYALKATRDAVEHSGDIIAQQLVDNVTLTSTPAAVQQTPVMGADWTVFRDATSANLGTTKLARCYSAEFDYTGVFGPHWPADRSLASFATHVDLAPATGFKLAVQADAQGMTALSDVRGGVTEFYRWEAIGDLLDNLQTLTISGTPTGGTFTLTYKAQTTAAIQFNAAASAVQSALEALTTIGVGNVAVSGGPGPGTPYVVSFIGALAQDATLLTHTDSFTGGTSPALAITQTTQALTYRIDVAAKVRDKIELTDGDDVLEAVYEMEIVEDTGWGHAGQVTIINARTTL